MFTLNRVTTISFGAGLVLVGCASPVGETPDTAETSAALTTEEDAPTPTEETAEAITEETTAAMPPGMASAFEIPANAPGLAPPSDDAVSEDGDTKSEKWGFGWGGGWGAPGMWGGGWGAPGLGWGRSWVSPGSGWGGGWGFGRSVGWGWGTPGIWW